MPEAFVIETAHLIIILVVNFVDSLSLNGK